MVRKTIAFVMVCIFSFGMVFCLATKARAQGVGMDYGGFVYVIVPCTCSDGVWVMLVNPNPDNASFTGPYLWSLSNPPQNDDIALAYPFPGMSLLGQYINNGEQCQITIGTGCVTLPTRGTFSTVTGKGIQPYGI